MAFAAQRMNIELLIFFHFFYQQTAQLFQFLQNVYKYQLLLLPPACLPQHSPPQCNICISLSPGSTDEHLIRAFGALTYDSTPLLILACLRAPFSMKSTHSCPAHLSAPAWLIPAVIYGEHVPKGNVFEGQIGRAISACQDKQ